MLKSFQLKNNCQWDFSIRLLLGEISRCVKNITPNLKNSFLRHAMSHKFPYDGDWIWINDSPRLGKRVGYIIVLNKEMVKSEKMKGNRLTSNVQIMDSIYHEEIHSRHDMPRMFHPMPMDLSLPPCISHQLLDLKNQICI